MEAPQLLAQILDVRCAGVQSRGGRRLERGGKEGMAVEQPQRDACRVENVPLVTRMQVRTRGGAFRRGHNGEGQPKSAHPAVS